MGSSYAFTARVANKNKKIDNLVPVLDEKTEFHKQFYEIL